MFSGVLQCVDIKTRSFMTYNLEMALSASQENKQTAVSG